MGIVVQYTSKYLTDTHSLLFCFIPAGISSNWSDDQPYSWSEAPYHPPTQRYKEARVCPQTDGSFGRNLVCPVEVKFQPGGSLPDLQSLDEATKFLRAQSNASLSPFFLAVGFHKPHVPLKYPTKYRGKYNCRCLVVPHGCPNLRSQLHYCHNLEGKPRKFIRTCGGIGWGM